VSVRKITRVRHAEEYISRACIRTKGKAKQHALPGREGVLYLWLTLTLTLTHAIQYGTARTLPATESEILQVFPVLDDTRRYLQIGIVAPEEVAGSSPVGHPPEFLIGKPR
jgi:hypothetical protein